MARVCGTCTLCCKVMGIGALNKPAGRWCPHCLPGKGCSIYDLRPTECGTFNCDWLVQERLGPEWKPEKCKIVMTSRDNRIVAYVDPSASAAWRKSPFYETLIALMTHGLPHGKLVHVAVAGRYTLLLPGREEDLGCLSPQDEVRLETVRTPKGLDYRVAVLRPGS